MKYRIVTFTTVMSPCVSIISCQHIVSTSSSVNIMLFQNKLVSTLTSPSHVNIMSCQHQLLLTSSCIKIVSCQHHLMSKSSRANIVSCQHFPWQSPFITRTRAPTLRNSFMFNQQSKHTDISSSLELFSHWNSLNIANLPDIDLTTFVTGFEKRRFPRTQQ